MEVEVEEIPEAVATVLQIEERITGALGALHGPAKRTPHVRRPRGEAARERKREEDRDRLRRLGIYVTTAFAVTAQAVTIGTMYRSHADLVREERLRLDREVGAVIASDRLLEQRALTAAERDLGRGRVAGIAVSEYYPASETAHAFRHGDTTYVADFSLDEPATAMRFCVLAGYGRPIADLRDPHAISFTTLGRDEAVDAAAQIRAGLDRDAAGRAYDDARRAATERARDRGRPAHALDIPFSDAERDSLVRAWTRDR